MNSSEILLAEELKASDRYKRLSESIKQIVEDPLNENNVRVIAGAGSGKTETIAFRIVNLLLTGAAKPEEIVAFTFTEKAAEALKARIYQRTLALKRNDILKNIGFSFIGTIHAFCFHLLQDHFNYANFKLLDEATERIFLQRVGYQLKLNDTRDNLESKFKIKIKKWRDGSLYSFMCNMFIESYNIFLNEMLNQVFTPGSNGMQYSDLEPFIGLMNEYFSLLDKNRLLTFSQVIDLAITHLEKDKTPIAMRKFIFVDEYQDINKAQERLIQLLGTNAIVFVVGDPKQTIYNWRGSTNKFFTQFQDLFPEKALKEFKIPENWRSFPAIVNAANSFAQEANIDEFNLVSDSKRNAHRGLTAKMMFETDIEEADYITDQIKSLVDAEKICEYNDIAILLRSVKTSAYPIIKKCVEKGIPYIIGGKVGLFNRKEIQAIVRFLLWIGEKGFWKIDSADKITQEVFGYTEDNLPKETGDMLLENGLKLWFKACEECQIEPTYSPDYIRNQLLNWRESWFTRIHESESRLGNSKKSIEKAVDVFDNSDTELDIDNLEFKGDNVKIIKTGGMSSQKKYDAYIQGITVLEIFNDLLFILGIKKLDYNNNLHATLMSNCARLSRILNDFEFTNKLGGRIKTFDSMFYQLNFYLSDYRYIFEETPDAESKYEGGVNIFTVHQSKGLEWPVVFLPGIVPGRFPVQNINKYPANFLSIKTIKPPIYPIERYITTIEDEARLLYVGMTRAKNILFMSEYQILGIKRKNTTKSNLLRMIDFQDFSIDEKEKPLHQYPDFPPKKEFENKETFFLEEFGITALADYLKCPFFYRFRHVWEYAAVLNRFLGFGTAIHYILRRLIEKTVTEAEGLAEDNIERILTEIMRTEFELPYLSKKITDGLAKSIYNNILEHVVTHLSEFNQCLFVENHIEFLNENAILNGIIDVIFKDTKTPLGSSDQIHIRDYKTQKMELNDIHAFQILLYSAAMNALDYQVTGGSIAFIKENEVVPIEINVKTIQETKDKARLIVEDINKKRYKRNDEETPCKKEECDYFIICNQTI